MNSDQGDLLYTPRRAQKCLFAPSNGNFCKKNASQDSNCGRDAVSGEDSDLGPMSPLALTDRSPSLSDSSSGREFISPFATPEKSFSDASVFWDRLISKRSKEDRISPFSSLKKITRAARYSPRCKLTSNSRSLPSSPRKLMEPSTPQRSKIMSVTMDEIVPETPQRSFATEIQNQSITETPRKSRTPECRQITPLNSISRTAPLPKLHRRKSFSGLGMNENLSPEQKENTLKRRAHDQLTVKPAKLFKTDDVSVPRARAALFQERKSKSNLKNISLSTKSFYSSNAKTERPFVFGNFSNSDVKRRRSLPAQNMNRRSLLKKQKFGKINAGVFHGIKKLKKPKAKPEVLKKEEHVAQNSATSNKSPPTNEVQMNAIAEKVPSPEIDDSKRFFKTKRLDRPNHAVTVMNQKHILATNVRKQQVKTTDICLDTTDLTVDEPEIEATLEQDKVNNLLKILEDDWADDDYDTMETLTNNTANMISPLKPTKMPAENTIMSPATELSNMTSTMNIKDVTSVTNFGNLSLDNTDSNKDVKTGENDKGYFPLFNKGYSASNNIFEYVLQCLCYIYKSQIIFIIIENILFNIYI